MSDKDKTNMQDQEANVEVPKEVPMDATTLSSMVAQEKLNRATNAKKEIDAVLKKHKCLLTAKPYIKDNGTIGAVAKVEAV
jgi:hypothetical protein